MSLQEDVDKMVKMISMSFLKHLKQTIGNKSGSKDLATFGKQLRENLRKAEMASETLRVEMASLAPQRRPLLRMIQDARMKTLESKRMQTLNVLVMITCMSNSIAICHHLTDIMSNILLDCTEAYEVMKDILERGNQRNHRMNDDILDVMKGVVANTRSKMNQILSEHTSLQVDV